MSTGLHENHFTWPVTLLDRGKSYKYYFGSYSGHNMVEQRHKLYTTASGILSRDIDIVHVVIPGLDPPEEELPK